MDALLQQYDQRAQLLKLAGTAAATDMAFAATDPNNNDDFDPTTMTPPPPTAIGKEDKYSLRPRSVRRVTETMAKSEAKLTTANAAAAATEPLSTPAPPHPLKTTKAKGHKPKQKPAPLSKYRRKTANARERNRMREINQAFETLRRVIPQKAPPTHTPSPNEKLTKITTLRLAMKYISSLSAALNQNTSGGHQPDFSFMDASFGSDCGDLDCLLLESDGESLPLSDHSSLLASPDFPETSLSPVDFGDPNSLSPFLQTDYDHSDFSDFLLT